MSKQRCSSKVNSTTNDYEEISIDETLVPPEITVQQLRTTKRSTESSLNSESSHDYEQLKLPSRIVKRNKMINTIWKLVLLITVVGVTLVTGIGIGISGRSQYH